MSIPINDIQSGCRFYPVQCSEKTLQGLTPQEGHVYFTTDSKKIYLARRNTDQSMVLDSMCSSTGFYYGTKEIQYDNTGNTPDPNVIFSLDEIEGDGIPLIDDLILNVDGCFYRVKNVDVDIDEIKTERLTLQGSGVGGGGGGTGSTASYKLSAVGGTNKIFSAVATTMPVGFKANYNGTDTDNGISYVSCTMKGAELPFFELSLSESDLIPFNSEYTIDLVNYTSNFSTVSQKSFTLTVQDKYGEERSMTFYIQLVELSLTATQDEIFYSLSDNYIYDCNINGGTALNDRKVIYSFYTESNLTTPIKTIEYLTTTVGNVKKTLDLKGLTHGTYVLKVQAVGNISGNVTVKSNILTHKLLKYDETDGSSIFSVVVPEKTEQFSNIPLQALLVTGGSNQEYTLEIKLNGVVETRLKITAHTPLTYNLLFEDRGNYTLTMTIIELAKTFTTLLEITKYTGDLPVIDTDRDDLELYLNPRGKTNEVLDRDIWLSPVGDKHEAKLSNFYYGDINGWSIDNTGASYLKLSQGAKLEVPTYRPFKNDAMSSNNYGITVELDFKISSVLDSQADIISCISTDRNGIIYGGFKITGNQALFYTSIKNGAATGDKPVTLNIVENQRIKITYVVEKNSVDFPMILAYLNGKVSSVSKYEKTDHLADAGGDNSVPATIKINSDSAQVDIYGIRIYSAALDQSIVLKNYQATLGTLEEREASYKSNLILDNNNKVDLRYLEDENYPLSIPYIKITGGYSAADKKAMTMGVPGKEFALPIGKKDFRLINFELIYPQTGYFKERGYTNFSEICTFESGKDATSINPAYGETPLTGAVMYAQGTSSLEYPVKNLRIKFKTKKVSVRPGMEPVDLVCLKADFMESSGSHNTGAANFIDDVYKMANLSTPGQDYYSDEDIVTCIKGHPVAVFWSPSGADGTYEYIGKYNFNLDKATPEPFGFKNTPKEYDPNATEKFGWDENGNNTIRCFEYLDNSVRVCNFLPKDGKTYHDTWYDLIVDPITGKSHYGWTEGFESRHPEDLVGQHEADCIYTMASWVNELHNLKQTDKPKALARFANEYQSYFNKDYLLGYYLITNVLLMIDSRTKNCMMASWGPESGKGYYPLKQNADGTWTADTEGEFTSTNNYIWYPIFYDMDTMLGIDNQGYPRLKYYYEDTNPEVFNGNDVLWDFVREALPGEISTYYEKFESASGMFTADTILPYFNDNQANLANEALYNGDTEYKYIDTFREGYYDHLNTNEKGEPTFIEPGKGSRLYAAQGDRSLDRQYFVTNRINFLRGKYQSDRYKTTDRIEFRMYMPTGDGEESNDANERVRKSIAEIPPDKKFTLTALGPGFAGVRFGQNGAVVNYQFTNDDLIATITSDQDPADLESYILGLNNLKDIGDLSDKYLKTFTVKNENKLERIILGNDFKDYFNPYWGKTDDEGLDVQACKLLKEFNMINCVEYRKALNFTDCKQLERLYLTGSSVTTLFLPEGTAIKEMRLPDTLQTLSIKNQQFLQKDKFSIGHYEYGTDKYIFLPEGTKRNGHYENTYNSLRYVEILNTPIDSYSMAMNAPNLQEYCFTGVDWEILENNEQICSLFEEDFVLGNTYYKYDNDKYVEYTPTAYENGLYEKISLINDDNTITRIPVLERLRRISPYGGIELADALTGTLKINPDNGENKPYVDQFDIYYRYNKIFPNLSITYGDNITGETAYRIEFYRTDETEMTNDVTPDYVVMTDGSKTFAELTGENSPAGQKLFTPVKSPTNTEIFEFSGVWVDWDTKETYDVETFDTTMPFADQPTNKTVMRLVPRFTPYTRFYSVIFHDYDNSEVFRVDDLQFEDNVGAAVVNIPQAHYLYRKSDGLAAGQRYTLKGWQTEASFRNPETAFSLYNLNELTIVDNLEMWAYYESEEVATTSSPMNIFTFSSEGISIKEEYRNLVGGDITIPTKNDVFILKDFKNMPLVTGIYFLSDAKYTKVADYCFSNNMATEIDLPNTIITIGIQAFYNALNLITINLNDNITSIGEEAFRPSDGNNLQVHINELPKNLTSLGDRSFYKCGPNVIITKLPDGVNNIPTQCFMNAPNVAITEFTSREGNCVIGNQAFWGAGKNPNATTIVIESPWILDPAATGANSNAIAPNKDSSYPYVTTLRVYEALGSDTDLEKRFFGEDRANVAIEVVSD